MSKNTETLKAFYTAFENHEWPAARRLLYDDFYFRGPSQQADSADVFIGYGFKLLAQCRHCHVVCSFLPCLGLNEYNTSIANKQIWYPHGNGELILY